MTQLPETLCHNEASGSNLIARTRDDGSDETVAIDWESIGVGFVGQEIAGLAIGPLRRFEVDASESTRLDEVVFQGYFEGLRDAGWRDDERLARFGYSAAISLRLPHVIVALRSLLEESQCMRVEQTWDRPFDQVIKHWAPVTYFLLNRADEARMLLRSLDLESHARPGCTQPPGREATPVDGRIVPPWSRASSTRSSRTGSASA